jgi:hypothetical protein
MDRKRSRDSTIDNRKSAKHNLPGKSTHILYITVYVQYTYATTIGTCEQETKMKQYLLRLLLRLLFSSFHHPGLPHLLSMSVP